MTKIKQDFHSFGYAAAFIPIYWTKYIVVQRFDLYESVNILPVFNLTYVRNYGAAFSFLAGT